MKIFSVNTYIKLENIFKTNLSLSHIYILDKLIKYPNKWHNKKDFPLLSRSVYGRITMSLIYGKNEKNNTHQRHMKNLFWLEEKKSHYDKRIKEIRLSERGKNNLKFLIDN